MHAGLPTTLLASEIKNPMAEVPTAAPRIEPTAAAGRIDGATVNDVIIISPQEFLDRAAQPINPYLSVLVEQSDPDISAARCFLSEWEEHPTPRSQQAAHYIINLARCFVRAPALDAPLTYPRTTVFQADDNPADALSVSWERQSSWEGVRLIPDLYYYQALGYEGYMPDAVTSWADRQRRVIWRGASTGIVSLTEAALENLDRYRLCRAANTLGNVADIKISDIVQAASDEEKHRISQRMTEENILGSFFPMEEMTNFKFVADIGGNSNSWNFMAKLRLGACVLRVESAWQQWFSDELLPWVHYVPISSDLTDFVDKIEWCLRHDSEAEAIAQRGREFALQMRYDVEMAKAARIMFSAERTSTSGPT